MEDDDRKIMTENFIKNISLKYKPNRRDKESMAGGALQYCFHPNRRSCNNDKFHTCETDLWENRMQFKNGTDERHFFAQVD